MLRRDSIYPYGNFANICMYTKCNCKMFIQEKNLTFHQEIIAGGRDPLHLHVISFLLPALNGAFCPSKRTSKGLRYISIATLTTNGGCSWLLLTSQLYTASKWFLFKFSIFKILCDFLRSGIYCVSSVTNSPSLHQDTLANGLPPEATHAKVKLAPSAYDAVIPFLTGPESSKTWTPCGATETITF